MPNDIWFAIGLMAVGSYVSRASGYWLMGFVTLTPRVRNWLGAIPMAVVGAVLGPAALAAGIPECVGFVTAFVVMRRTGNDLFGMAAALVAVAGLRFFL